MPAYKETPRQKMIAMMYLVLTALLALNVSVEVLEAFVVVNDSMEATNQNFANKIEGTYYKFEQQNTLNRSKVGPYYDKALQAKKLSEDLIVYLHKVKREVISRSERITPEQADTIPLRQLKTKDKYDESTNYFIGNSQDGSGGEARVLRNKIIDFKNNILEVVDPSERDKIKIGLDTDGPFYDKSGKAQNWEMQFFYHTILAANVTFINKLINEVQNAEYDVINHLYASIDAESFKFDQIEAKVIPSSSYVFLGDKYEAEILVAAYDSKTNPNVLIVDGADRVNDQNIRGARPVAGKDGVVKISMPATSEGLKRYAGVIRVPTPTGEVMAYPFKHEYLVAPPSVTVSATKMNVFYIGVDNPVSISVGGMADSQIQPSISVGTIRRVGNEWIVRVPEAQRAVINVVADGRNMGSTEFRVKRVPNPTPMIAGIESGMIDKGRLLVASAIIPTMPADFEFDLNFQIVSFTFVATRSGGDIYTYETRGNQLTTQMRSYIENMRRGEKIWLENIIATGPDGARRPLGTISLTIQ